MNATREKAKRRKKMKRWRTDRAVSRYEEAISELKAQLSAWAQEGRQVVLDALRYAGEQKGA